MPGEAGAVALPPLVATVIVHGADQQESHGGVFLLDFAAQAIDQVLDWYSPQIASSGAATPGHGLGPRGIAFFGDEIYLAGSDELFVYSRDFILRRSFRCAALRDAREIRVNGETLALVSGGRDSVVLFDLARQAFTRALHVTLGDEGPAATACPVEAADPLPGGSAGPALQLNNVHAGRDGLYLSGANTRGMLHLANDDALTWAVELPAGVHNAQPFRDGVLFNDTAAGLVRYVSRDGREARFAVPQYAPEDLTVIEPVDHPPVRQGFGRGLCMAGPGLVAAGSSPATLSLYDLDSGATIAAVNFSMDIRSTIHSVAIWPFAPPSHGSHDAK